MNVLYIISNKFFFTYCWYKNNLVGISGFFLKKYCNSFERNPHVMYYDILGNSGR